MKEIAWEKIRTKAAMGLELEKVPKRTGRSAFGTCPKSLFSKVQIKEGDAQYLSEGWTCTPL